MRTIKIAELWTWLTGNNPSQGGQNMSQPSSSSKDSETWFQKSFEGQIQVGILCSLKPAKDLSDTQPSLNDLITMELMEKVANSAPKVTYSDAVLCYKFSAKNGSFVCVNITSNITAGNIYLRWRELGFRILEALIDIVLLMYFPAILCLFTPTEVKTEETGRVDIVLRGTSPVGIRSCIANVDLTNWREKLICSFLFFLFCFVVWTVESSVLYSVLPPSLHLENIRHSMILRGILMFVFLALLTIRALVRICRTDLSFHGPCLICESFGDQQDICHDLGHKSYGREEIKVHLRLHPSIVLRCCKDSFDSLLSCLIYLLKCGVWFPLKFLLFLPAFCLIVLVNIVACLVKIAIVLFHSCPLSTFYDMQLYQAGSRANLRKAFAYWQVSVTVWASYLVVEMVTDLVTIIRGILMQLPDYLPRASLVVVIAYYIWKCYITFTRKYDNLAFKLYKHYKAKTEAGNNTEPVPSIDDSTRVIPKDLFDGACKKLMPLRESIGMLVVTIIPILAGILFLYFTVIMATPGADDTTQAIGTLITTLIPRIVEMMFGKDKEMVELDDTILNERVGSVVDEYIDNNNGGASTENEGENEQLDLTNDTIPLLPYGTFQPSENTTAAPSPTSTTTTNI